MRGDFGPASCPVCGSVGSRAGMLDHIEEAHPNLSTLVADRDRWIRAYNRLSAAVTRHVAATDKAGWSDDHDDALHAAHKRVLNDLTERVR